MPSGYLHKRCARQACEISGITPVETDVMVLGAQGPDPLFMLGIFPLRPSSRPSKLGNLLHQHRTGAFLRTLCRLAKENGGDVERAYALGFLTHYALDSTVHPYVYSQSYTAEGKYSSVLHTSLEKNWDSLYYQREGHKGTPVLMAGVTETRAQWPRIAALWQAAIAEVFPEQNVTVEMIEKALSDADRANGLTHSPRGVKYRVVGVLERIIGKPGLGTSQMAPLHPDQSDITNEAGRPWRNPAEPEEERTETVQELLDTAARRAAELLSAARQYFDGELDIEAFGAIIGNAGYDTGLESLP